MADANKRIWTKGQSAAINLRGRTLLVSAAAGSGKTATLTERIIRSLTDKEKPSDISKMLIVTFTKAAANELKERIFDALSRALADSPTNRHLNEQLVKLGSANICTIDSFYLNLLRSNFSILGISASARIADASETDILKQRVMDEVIEYFYDNDESFPALSDCFVGTRSINGLSEPLIKLYDDIMGYPEGVEFLKINAELLSDFGNSKTEFFETPYGRTLLSGLRMRLEYYHKLLSSAYAYSVETSEAFAKRALTYELDLEFVDALLSAVNAENPTYNSIRSLFITRSPAKLGSASAEDETAESLFYKTSRGSINSALSEIYDNIFSRTEEALCHELIATSVYVSKLYEVLSEFFRRFCEEKERRNIMDFPDIRRHTYRLLIDEKGEPTPIALKYREQFTDIYIDEYQDVDRVQDKIFSAIANDNRFMVGDIKQSIYGFRGAEPEVFADYKRRFFEIDPEHTELIPDGERETTVFMSENFRCDKNIIDFTNLVCSRLFASCASSIGYSSADDLRFSKPLPNDDYTSPKVDVSVIITKAKESDGEEKSKRKKADTDEPSNAEIEAEYIAEKIEYLINNEKKADGSPILPGDIAIIYRANSSVAILSDALRKRGFLCSEGGGDGYFESPDVLLVLSLLNVIDNPHRDIHMAGTLCSPIFGFTLDDLVKIRLNGTPAGSLYDSLLEYSQRDDSLAELCRDFEAKLSELRASSRALPVDRFLRILFESEIFASTGLFSDRNDYGEGGNLLRLYEYARTFESGSFKGLYNFIEFINSLIEEKKVLEVTAKDKSPDRINLTTMHHSKGLEFPVCFICGMGSRRNTRSLSKSLLYENSTGIAMKLSDSTGFARINSPAREAIKERILVQGAEEEMRILYVALTRARERLYLTATSNKSEEELLTKAYMQAKHSCPFLINSCTSFLDWILMPFADDSVNTECCELRFIYPEKAEVLDEQENGNTVTEAATIEADPALYEKLCRDFAFEYPHRELLRIPAKLSVSKLSPDILDSDDGSCELFGKPLETRIPDFFISGKPSLASASERGTATHLFMQFCDIENARRSGASEELSRLVLHGFIPQNIADIIYVDELEKFVHGELADKIASSARVIREQRFNLLIPAEAFSQNDERIKRLSGESLAVQGVIDLILIDKDGNIELYDYKTDRLTKNELISPSLAAKKMNDTHGLQLSYYAYAVSELFGKKCSRVAVYSTHSAELYDIEPVPLRLTDN
ncbi:MAG: helicase-exonuclease AddAB subunit AddA [Ruminococcaceae bacterium]|nr:helicase-exonuclease AddAB subunit AddA [Oscillospiraceae bacterium]